MSPLVNKSEQVARYLLEIGAVSSASTGAVYLDLRHQITDLL
jgi:hypothetical protein